MDVHWQNRRAPRPPGEDTTTYIAAISGELSALARRQGYGILAYLLDMVRLEAESQGERRRQCG